MKRRSNPETYLLGKITGLLRSFQSLAMTVIILFPVNAYSAAWLIDKGKSQNVYSLSFYSSDHFYDQQGNRINIADRYDKRSFSNLYEYGLTDGLTVGFNYNFDWASQGTEEELGYSGSEFFLRSYLYEGEAGVLSVQPLIKLPAFEAPNINLPLSNNEIEAEIRLLYGKGYKHDGVNNFINAEVAYRRAIYDHIDGVKNKSELILDLSAGFRANKNRMVLAQVFSKYSLSDFDNLSLFQSNNHHVKAQLSYVFKVTRNNSIQIGGYADIYARNTGKGKGFFVSLWREF